ncbi:MAG: phosphoenolpyruvate--protein phosphotransferase [Victivallales bacterium]|nr:phosphoenolpyruvate--protein phosphotransferase [Victivallales bacterium]
MTPTAMTMKLEGIGVSEGIVIAKCRKKSSNINAILERKILPEEVEYELARLRQSIALSRTQLEEIRENVKANGSGDVSEILEFHIMLLEDEELLSSIEAHLRKDLTCIEKAIEKACRKAANDMESMEDPYMQARADDIRDVEKRLLLNLGGVNNNNAPQNAGEPRILLAEDLTPSEAAHIDTKCTLAFITCSGSRTSHTAILARALSIPAIVAVKQSLDDIPDDALIAMDAKQGIAFVNPSQEIVDTLEERRRQRQQLSEMYATASNRLPETRDGYQTYLVANVELPSEALNVKEKYNVGIGLFRTEFLFIASGHQLTEEEQFNAYRDTVKAVHPYSVIFRTLDIGGDKFMSQLQSPKEINPFMGTRAIRLSLRCPDMFKTQIRAILRASAFGKVRMMFPMISAVEELTQALALVDEVKEELRNDGLPFNEHIDIGCMVEVPSAALVVERLVEYVDFFSIGTNDLVQYSLAVDRANADIAYLYQPAHPAVLRLIKHVIDTAIANGKWVSVCGEMAGDALYTPLLLGMGIQELSMSPVSLAPVHRLISSISRHDAEELVEAALKCNNGNEVEALCRDFINSNCPELISQ